MKRGTQVIYSPSHAEGLDDPCCEKGFVTKVEPGWAMVRYFYADGSLRTTANSERTPVRALTVQDHRPQVEIDLLLFDLGYT